jgi:hypothetical protein
LMAPPPTRTSSCWHMWPCMSCLVSFDKHGRGTKWSTTPMTFTMQSMQSTQVQSEGQLFST